jgi:hypothetical protein
MSGHISEDVVRVHLENASDIAIQRTEEKEPEHFSFSTVVVASATAGINPYEQVLAEDPLRKDFSIMAVDSPVIICHAASQLTDKANQVAGVPFPQGAYLPAGGSVTGTGTGRLWVVATVTTASRVSLFVNRRDK